MQSSKFVTSMLALSYINYVVKASDTLVSSEHTWKKKNMNILEGRIQRSPLNNYNWCIEEVAYMYTTYVVCIVRNLFFYFLFDNFLNYYIKHWLMC